MTLIKGVFGVKWGDFPHSKRVKKRKIDLLVNLVYSSVKSDILTNKSGKIRVKARIFPTF
jgi:hypothetical protein